MKKLPKVTKKELLEQMSGIGDSDMIKKAFDIAQEAHSNQKRENGGSYLYQHVYYVTSLLLSSYRNDKDIEVLLVSALLHDTVEDAGVKISHIQKVFGDRVAEIVSLLSKPSEKESEISSLEEKYMETQNYLEKLSGNREAVIVKIFDRIANVKCIDELAVERNPKKYLRYYKETKNLYIPLAKKYDLQKQVKILESEIDRVEGLLGNILLTYKY